MPLESGTINEVMRAPYGMNLAVMFVEVMVYSVGAPVVVVVEFCAMTEVMPLATASNETKEASMVTSRSILKSGQNSGREREYGQGWTTTGERPDLIFGLTACAAKVVLRTQVPSQCRAVQVEKPATDIQARNLW